MSGNEGKQNSQMSMRDIEEDEMAQELMNMQMYEVGMNFEEMKQILRFVNESKDMAGIKPESQSSQEVTEYEEEIRGGEILPKNNSLRELIVEENSIPKPSFSYRQQQSERKSPTISGRKSTLQVSPVEKLVSAGSQDMFDNEDEEEGDEAVERIPKRSSLDGELIFDKLMRENEEEKQTNDKDDVNDNGSQTRSRNPWKTSSDNSQNSQNSLSGETNNENNNKSKKNQRIERWKLDPTDSIVEENDLPLRDRNRSSLKERIPYYFCHNKRILDKNIEDKLLAVLNYTLEEVADIWRNKHRPDASDFQWGSPIKVGAFNRSLDKKRVIEDPDSPERCEFIQRINLQDSVQPRHTDRNCKRKAVEDIRHIVANDSESNGDSQDAFERVKKARKIDELWQPPVKFNLNKSARGSLTRQDRIFNIMKNSNNETDGASVIDDVDSDEFDNDNLSNLRQKNKQQDQKIADGRASSPGVFPRRIIPPNPSKPKVVRRAKKNGERNKRKSPVRKNTQAVLQTDTNFEVSRGRAQVGNKKGNNYDSMDDAEISNKLDKDDTEEIDLDEEIEIKPLPIKGLASKLSQGTVLLLEKKKAEERSKLAKMQADQEAKIKEKMKKEEREITRYLKEKEEQKERETKERDNKAKEEIWKKNAAARDRERRRMQAEKKARSAVAADGVLLMDDDDDNVDSLINSINARQKSADERVQCPICHLEFSKKEIQNHAADCNQFDNLDEPGTSRSSANNDDVTITNDNAVYDCNVCFNFTTTDGIVYEDHVHSCMKNKNDRMDRQNQSDSGTLEIVEVPSSPIRSFLPISKITGSSINYTEQFSQEKVKPNTMRVKRRR